jgi:hypothetical protein
MDLELLRMARQQHGIGRTMRAGQGVALADGQRWNVQGHGGAGF